MTHAHPPASGYPGCTTLRNLHRISDEPQVAEAEALLQVEGEEAAAAHTAEIPVQYLASAETSMEDVARKLAPARGVMDAPVCLLTRVEPFQGYEVYRKAATQKLQLGYVHLSSRQDSEGV